MRAFPANSDELTKLRYLISYAEAGSLEYDAYHHSAKIPPPKRPTEMTINEVFQWIKDTPNQQHAIGRYQIIPSTLAGLVKQSGMTGDTVFHVQTQDNLANLLIQDAGYSRFKDGAITRTTFMANLAGIWAGLPLASGKSAYEGIAGNRATITRAAYVNYMSQIFPAQAQEAQAGDQATKVADIR